VSDVLAPASGFGAAAPERTAVHVAEVAALGESPTRRARLSARDVAVVAGCAVSAVALVWLVYEKLTPGTGALGFWLCSYVAFVALVYVVVREIDGHLVAVDRVATVVVATGALALLVPLVLIIGWVIGKGAHALRLNFFTQDSHDTGALTPLSHGGASQAIIGSLEQVGLALLFSVPLSLLTAVFLNEVRGPLRRPVRLFVDAMSGLPSIVAGLFIFALLKATHTGFSGFAAGLALAVLMLPTVTRTSEEVLRLVPSGLREASLALGSAQWRTVWSVVLPTARSGLVTAVVLGVARAIGETAPLLLTAFGNTTSNHNPFSGAQDALPLYVYKNYGLPSHNLNDRAFTGALVLVALVLVLFTIARVVGNPVRSERRAALVRLLTRSGR
jgi:phosphate transport system permease protein